MDSDLVGFVLTGGRSKRMGKPKALISYHGKPQALYIYEWLEGLGMEVCFSENGDSSWGEQWGKAFLKDQYEDKGPLGAILSGLEHFQGKSLLVVACDMPLVDEELIQQLLADRDPSQAASLFCHGEDKKIEPMLSIWEPASVSFLRAAVQENRLSLLKLLRSIPVHLTPHDHPEVFLNINDPADYESFTRHP